MRIRYLAAAAVSVSIAVAGCSQDSSAPAVGAATPHIKAAPAAKKGPSAEELTAGMAIVPALGKSSLPLDMKFELDQRPKIGQALDIDLALIPQVDGGSATVQVTDSNGLDAVQGGNQFDIPEIEAGGVYRHTLHMMPTTEGVLLVNLTVTVKHDDVTDSKAFSLPLIVDR
jgi:hypothetical protein